MKIATITFENIKCTDGLFEMCGDLFGGEEADTKCYEMFQYGEFATITVQVDENFKIVGGYFHKTGKT